MKSNVDLKLDISDMSSVKDQTFDLLIVCDILEHVFNDKKAIQEIYRVLSPGGWAIITVPQKDDEEQTFKDPTAITPEAKTRLFGQSDHLRLYGNNFPSLLESAGFKVIVVTQSDFPKNLVEKHTLFPPILSDNPIATNYRKVFFAHKNT